MTPRWNAEEIEAAIRHAHRVLRAHRHEPGLRVSTADREAVVGRLGEHYARGRLSLADYNVRTAAALRAQVDRDLRFLDNDLPRLPPKLPAIKPLTAAPVCKRMHVNMVTLLITAWVLVSSVVLVLAVLFSLGPR